ncbi:MAG: hypothetical protein P1U46_01555 [Patescibacteria group bacterium]|nr:hypothetical protein [Patescibacteria group bacterium]
MQLFNTYINIIGKIIEEKTEIKDKYYTKKIVNHINKNDISIISGIKYI